MLNPNPETRITAEKALNHHFFNKDFLAIKKKKNLIIVKIGNIFLFP